MKIDQVLEEYRKGDADRRMSLFLCHRGLRDEFSCIEQEDPADLFAGAVTPERAKESMVRKFLVLLKTGSWPLRSPASGGRIAS